VLRNKSSGRLSPRYAASALPIFTIGHSTRSIGEFIALLKAHKIETVIDIRTIPKSSYCPQFNAEDLKRSLRNARIGYRHIKQLGGLRHPLKNSNNTGWVNASFRGFADYMQTPEFQMGLEKLENIVRKKRSALMCAEAVPWRCHRSLIADALAVRKWKVLHIQSKKRAKRHSLTPFLKIKKGMYIYPALE
jgi:uncharacterized protein (DUF488 family)